MAPLMLNGFSSAFLSTDFRLQTPIYEMTLYCWLDQKESTVADLAKRGACVKRCEQSFGVCFVTFDIAAEYTLESPIQNLLSAKVIRFETVLDDEKMHATIACRRARRRNPWRRPCARRYRHRAGRGSPH